MQISVIFRILTVKRRERDMAAEPRATGAAVFARTLAALRELTGRYEDMIVADPDFTSKLESGLRLASYLLPGGLQLEKWGRAT